MHPVERPLRILFVFRHGGYVRNFESLLVELAERGHDVHALLGHDRMRWLQGRRPPIEIIAERHARVTWSVAEDTRDTLTRPANGLRITLDWLRYLEPEYARAPKLRARVEERVPPRVRRALLRLGAATPAGRVVLRRFLSAVEKALPPSRALAAQLARHAPDVVCVTPLVDMGNNQPDVLRAARTIGVPGVLCVASWDNLTNKGLIRGEPDLVTVWNELQREEAVALHRRPPETVVATGAQSYDHWFTWRRQRSRGEFCAEVGLDPDRPFVAFLGSSPFIAPKEVDFARRWVEALRAADAPVRDVGVLVRPHPQNGEQWREADLSGLAGIAVWPRGGADPVDSASRADFHDTLEFCAAVVGINTSALIESAVVGRPVLTILAADFRETQEGTLHFEHLRRAGGGVLIEASDLDEHIAQLSAVLRGDDGFAARNRRFLEVFVRPHGLEHPAASLLADALERAAATGPRALPAPGAVQRAARFAWRALAVVGPTSTAGKAPATKQERARRKAQSPKQQVATELRQ